MHFPFFFVFCIFLHHCECKPPSPSITQSLIIRNCQWAVDNCMKPSSELPGYFECKLYESDRYQGRNLALKYCAERVTVHPETSKIQYKCRSKEPTPDELRKPKKVAGHKSHPNRTLEWAKDHCIKPSSKLRDHFECKLYESVPMADLCNALTNCAGVDGRHPKTSEIMYHCRSKPPSSDEKDKSPIFLEYRGEPAGNVTWALDNCMKKSSKLPGHFECKRYESGPIADRSLALRYCIQPFFLSSRECKKLYVCKKKPPTPDVIRQLTKVAGHVM